MEKVPKINFNSNQCKRFTQQNRLQHRIKIWMQHFARESARGKGEIALTKGLSNVMKWNEMNTQTYY